MVDLFSLIKDTGAYKIVSGDIKSDRLSHAYLLLTPDGENLLGYLKTFAKLIMCETSSCCNKCRACRLIDDQTHPDVNVFPKTKDSVVVEDISALIEDSYIKPIEGTKKLFLIAHGETMNVASQNKLLKTLEEPPKNVHIIIGATSEFALLPTIKSRVKKLEIPPFTKDKLMNALKEDYPDTARLSQAVGASDGTVGKTVALYGDDNLTEILDAVCDTLINMQSSRDVLAYSVKISALKGGFDGFVNALELTLRDMLFGLDGKEELVLNTTVYNRVKSAKGYNRGALIYALETLMEVSKRRKFNANQGMLTEWMLFQILEGKFKWQKS